MVDEISKMSFDQLSKYVSPERTQGASEKASRSRYQKISSNIMKQITVKLNRLGRHFTKDEWVHDNAVAKELDKRLTKLEESINKVTKPEMMKIAANLEKIQNVASNFIGRKKLTEDQDQLLIHLKNVTKAVKENCGLEVTEQVRPEPKAKKTAMPLSKVNIVEVQRKSQKPAEKSNLPRDIIKKGIKKDPLEKSGVGAKPGQNASVTIFQLQKNLGIKKSELQEKLIQLRTAAFYTISGLNEGQLQKDLSREQPQLLDKIKKQDIADMDTDQMAEFYEDLATLIEDAVKNLPKSHQLPPIQTLLIEIPTLHDAISELEKQIGKLKNTMVSAVKPIKPNELINAVKQKLNNKKLELQKKLIELSTDVFDTSIGINADKLSNKLDDNQRGIIENLKKQVVESMNSDQIEESYTQLLSLIQEAHEHMLKTMNSYQLPTSISPLMIKIDEDINSIETLERQLKNLQR